MADKACMHKRNDPFQILVNILSVVKRIKGNNSRQWTGIFTAQTLKAYDFVVEVCLAVAVLE